MKKPIKEFTLDADGYPSDSTLRCISRWDHVLGYGLLMERIHEIWYFADCGYFRRHGRKYRLSTAGWSGNESIIRALQKNLLFWSMCWCSSKRGGHYRFELAHVQGASRCRKK